MTEQFLKPEEHNAHGGESNERKTMLIWAIPQTEGACRACGAPIVWVMTEKKNRWHPMDASFEAQGRDGAFNSMIRVYCDQSHFATCPKWENK